MKTLSVIVSSFALAFTVAACGDDSPSVDASSGIDSAPAADADTTDAGWPAMPTLANQVDRAGRAAITSALVSTFRSDDGSGAPSYDATVSGNNKDAYNQDDDPSGWISYAPDLMRQMAVLDSLDAHLNGLDNPTAAAACGNQVAADLAGARYSALAGLLTGDMLFVNSASGSCNTYLGVEANAVLGIANTDCGGRTPIYDVIGTTYSVLSGVGLAGFDDGVTTDDGGAVKDVFPFIGAPLGN